MTILKFGGTSVATKKNIETICDIVLKERKNRPVVVVSAIQGVTDLLISSISKKRIIQLSISKKIVEIHTKLIEQLFPDIKEKKKHILFIKNSIKEIDEILKISKEYDLALQDKIASYGEIMSSYLIAQALTLKGVNVAQIIASDIVITNDNYGDAKLDFKRTKKKIDSKLKPIIDDRFVPVITGFIGATKNGNVTTLGRGGSDYSASIIGSCLNVTEIQIWTDVDGVFTADPKIVKNAKIINNISYRLAEIYAESGARVLHPKTIRPVVKRNIPIRILNIFKPEGQGTLIDNKDQNKTKTIVYGVTHKLLPENKIMISIVGINFKSKTLLKEIKNFLIKRYEHDVNFNNKSKYSYHFLTMLKNPDELINAIHSKFIGSFIYE